MTGTGVGWVIPGEYDERPEPRTRIATVHHALIDELGDGCNDGGDLPGLLGRAARTIEEGDRLLEAIRTVLTIGNSDVLDAINLGLAGPDFDLNANARSVAKRRARTRRDQLASAVVEPRIARVILRRQWLADHPDTTALTAALTLLARAPRQGKI